MDTRIQHWHHVKTQKYLWFKRMITVKECFVFAVEVGALGTVSSSVEELLIHLKIPKPDRKRLKGQLSETALECSRLIFNSRNKKEWPFVL